MWMRTFLKIFRFEIIQGNNTPLLNSTGMVMTRSCAKNILGMKTQSKNGGVNHRRHGIEQNKIQLSGRAVLDDVPANSSLQFDILLPFRAFEDNYKSDLRSNWHWKASFDTFIEVRDDNVDLPSLESKMYKAIPEAARTEWHASGAAKAIKYPLLRFSDLHFDAARQKAYELIALKVSDKSQLFILVLIGIAILLIAEMNFVSLTTAKALKRAKEVSIRKIVGAGRKHLALQFLLDAWLHVMIGLIFAFTLLQITKPLLADWLDVSVGSTSEWNYLSIFFVLIFIVSIVLMGFVPAYYLSGIFPVSALKGKLNQTPGGGFL